MSEKMSQPDFIEVTQGSNWAYWDELRGVRLKEHDPIEVSWPDGTLTRERVQLYKSHEKVLDMGHYTEVPREDSYISVMVNGLSVPVPLRESHLECRLVLDSP